MSDIVKIKMTLSTRVYGSEVSDTVEVSRQDWDAMTIAEQEDFMLECYEDFLSNQNQGSYWVEE